MSLLPHHLKELQSSGIDEALAGLNFESLQGNSAYDALLYSDKLDRLNGGRLSSKWLKRYRHIKYGGWWASGLDPLNNWEAMLWGCFKPDSPKKGAEGKPIKYEHPPKTETRAFFLKVTLGIWHAVSRNSNTPMPENIVISEDGEALGFWQWVIDNPHISIILTEGAKKAASLLSVGIVAVALPGIFSGYRQPKDAEGRKIGNASLIPELKVFAQEGREVVFAFDKDKKRKTQHNVKIATGKTGRLFIKEKCKVSVLDWNPLLGKGIDDVLVSQGIEVLASILPQRDSLDTWELKQSARLSYSINLELSSRYLGEFLPPIDKQLICLKAGKGQNKTGWTASYLAPHLRNGGKVLVLTHRVQLGTEQSNRFGIPYISDLGKFDEGALFGYILCFDSLRKNSQAKFNPKDWAGAWIVIDEVVQALWHLLNSSTMKDERVEILQNFKELIQLVLATGGKIIVADADLNDLAIDYIKSLAGYDLEPWIVENKYQDESCEWKVYKYNGNTPEKLVAAMFKAVEQGEKIFVSCSGQRKKSRWGTQNLEALLKKKFPDKKILRVDKDSVADPEDKAYGCVGKLNDVVPHYDIVIASPTLETGVSINVKHFDSVWGIFQGVQTVDSCSQALARVRDNVPRHVWAKKTGLSFIAGGETSYNSIIFTQNKLAKINILSLSQADFAEEIDTNFQPESLRTWAKMAAYINMGMYHYKKFIFEKLEEEGHSIIDTDDEKMLQLLLQNGEKVIIVNDAEGENAKIEITNTKDEELETHIEEVVGIEIPENFDYQELKNKKARTKRERLLFEKATLLNKYGVDVTPELVEQDYDKWYSKIKLHYLFGVGRHTLSFKDKSRASSQLKAGDGAVWLPTFNRSQMSAKIKALDAIKFSWLLEQSGFRGNSLELKEWADFVIQRAREVKQVLGVTINPKYSPIQVAQAILGLIGFHLPGMGREGGRGQQVRVYGKPGAGHQKGEDGRLILDEQGQAIPISDGREEVFTAWLARDEEAMAKANSAVTPVVTPSEDKDGESVVTVVTADNNNIFISLDYGVVTTEGVTTEDEPTDLEKLIERVKLVTGEDEFWQLHDEVGRDALEDAVIYQGDRQKYQMLGWLRQGRG
ncbi:MAG TPA: plasmid replication protein, CyRepA1 family [Kamptonema sp.]|nr:plasmid replication protein, CyRepA1 family [Kamptonema sp.]